MFSRVSLFLSLVRAKSGWSFLDVQINPDLKESIKRIIQRRECRGSVRMGGEYDLQTDYDYDYDPCLMLKSSEICCSEI